MTPLSLQFIHFLTSFQDRNTWTLSDQISAEKLFEKVQDLSYLGPNCPTLGPNLTFLTHSIPFNILCIGQNNQWRITLYFIQDPRCIFLYIMYGSKTTHEIFFYMLCMGWNRPTAYSVHSKYRPRAKLKLDLKYF